MESKVTLTQTCRLCSAEFKNGALVFSEEGKRLYLQAKIRKYLYITVSMDDKISKFVCSNCCRKVEAIHRFASMAVRNQERLNKLMTENHVSVIEQKRQENKGLLHTYLTKGILEKPNEDTEEMEVKVDPMLFIQYNSDDDQSEDDEENLSSVMLESTEDANHKQPEAKAELKMNKSFECSSCVRKFHTESALQNHTFSHTSKNKRIILNNCNNFCTRPEVKQELEAKDDNEMEADNKAVNSNCDGEMGDYANGVKFTCPICGKVISTKGNLKVHLETHRPKGKYGCDICGRIFKTQCNLLRHKDYHTGIQFTCNVCGRVYPTNSTLRAHSITHSDLRPHKCPLCDKTFKRNQDLKFHINQHTGARPYKCPYCPKAFASSGNCFSHRKRMHPMEVERDRDLAAKIMR